MQYNKNINRPTFIEHQLLQNYDSVDTVFIA